MTMSGYQKTVMIPPQKASFRLPRLICLPPIGILPSQFRHRYFLDLIQHFHPADVCKVRHARKVCECAYAMTGLRAEPSVDAQAMGRAAVHFPDAQHEPGVERANENC